MPYEISLTSTTAKKIWNGRKKSTSSSFIPGLVDFHWSVEKLMGKSSSSNDDRAKQLLVRAEHTISKINKNIEAEIDSLKQEIDKQIPASITSTIKKGEGEKIEINFHSSLSRKAAFLVAGFDELVHWERVAAELQTDFEANFQKPPGVVSEKFFKQIRSLFYSVRQS